MRRRDLIIAIAGLAAATPWALRGQPAARMPRIGVLWHAANAQDEEPYFAALTEGLKDFGYVHGRNVTLEHRFPNEIPDQFKVMATELAALPVDVLIGIGAAASPYVKNATATIPVVFVFVPDPVGSKLVESLARPGGNATGLTSIAPELSGRRLQLLKEVIPDLTRFALLVNPHAQVSRLYVEEAHSAASRLGLEMQIFEAGSLDELPAAFKAMAAAGLKAAMVNQEGLFFVGRAQMTRLAIENRLPICVWSRETLEAGALISYGPDLVAIARRTAVLVDRILKGAKPAELPVEQPTKFQFLVNLKTAKALGLTIPPALLARADEVIE